jgi:hypothetical protein
VLIRGLPIGSAEDFSLFLDDLNRGNQVG